MNKTKFILLVLGSIVYLVLSFYGSLYVHELTHKFEYINIPKISDDLCVSILSKCEIEGGNHFGYYTFSMEEKYYEEALKIANTQELHAYTIQSIFLLFCYIIGYILFYKIVKK
jgi:hypothetical protein